MIKITGNPVIDSNTLLKNILLFCSWTIFVFLAGNKNFETWADIHTYLSYFNQARYIVNFEDYFIEYYDPLFLLLIKPFTFFENGFYYFLLVMAGVTLILKYIVFSKVSNNFLLLLLVYFSFLFFLHDYVQIRIALSLALFLWAMYIVKSNACRSAIFILSFFVHASIIILILFFILSKKLTKIKLVLLSLSIILFSNILIRFFSFIPKVSLYLQLLSEMNYKETNLFSSMVITQLITLSYLKVHYNTTGVDTLWLEYRLSWIGIVLFYAFYQCPVFAYRFYELFLIFFVILVSNICKKDLITLLLFIILIFSGLKTTFFGKEILTPF